MKTVLKIATSVTILILVDGFLQLISTDNQKKDGKKVTILILVDGFLQYNVVGSPVDIELSQSLF